MAESVLICPSSSEERLAWVPQWCHGAFLHRFHFPGCFLGQRDGSPGLCGTLAALLFGLTVLSAVGFFEIRNSLCLYVLCGMSWRNPMEVSFHTKKEDRISERAAATVFLRVQVIATCIISLFKALRLMLFLPILTCLTTLFALQSAAKNANC